MKIKNITKTKILLNLSRKVWLRAGAEIEVNSAQHKKCQMYQDRGLIKILGDEGAKIQAASAKKPEAEPAVESVVEEIIEAAAEEVEVLLSTEEAEQPVDMSSMSYKEIKDLADSLGVSGKGKKGLIEAINAFNEAN